MKTRDPESEEVTKQRSACCSFCGKGSSDEESLIEGPDRDGFGAAYICQDCVELCSEIFERRKQEHRLGEFEWTADLVQWVEEVLEPLSDQEREVVRLRYGLTDGYTYTLKEVGQRFGITRERVREIETEAIKRLQSKRQGPRAD
jgi:RNA polymerase sigma factor (sigma-70 family)